MSRFRVAPPEALLTDRHQAIEVDKTVAHAYGAINGAVEHQPCEFL
jgi:hypothetical protein